MRTGKIVTCCACGKNIYAGPQRLRNRTITCSYKCSVSLRRALPETVCDYCGKYFHKKKSHITKNNCCSVKCMGKLRETIFQGNANPNYKFKIDPEFLCEIDTEFKAWLLGWIGSDGHIAKDGNKITIQIHERDVDVLDKIVKELNLPSTIIKRYHRKRQVSISFCSKTWKDSVLRHLGLPSGGKKDSIVKFPTIDTILERHFIRGYFEGDGHVSSIQAMVNAGGRPCIAIESNSACMLNSIQAKVPCKTGVSRTRLKANSYNAINFLRFIYDGSTFFLERKHTGYLHVVDFLECNTNGNALFSGETHAPN